MRSLAKYFSMIDCLFGGGDGESQTHRRFNSPSFQYTVKSALGEIFFFTQLNIFTLNKHILQFSRNSTFWHFHFLRAKKLRRSARIAVILTKTELKEAWVYSAFYVTNCLAFVFSKDFCISKQGLTSNTEWTHSSFSSVVAQNYGYFC